MSEYKLVPVEPTLDMLCEGMEVYASEDCAEADVLGIYKAMLATAPAVQAEPVAYMFSDDWGRTKIVLGKETAEHWAPQGETIEPLYTAPQPAEHQPDRDVRMLAASLYQACGAYDMPTRVLDVLSAAANGEPFAHMIDGLLPCVPPSDQNVQKEPVAWQVINIKHPKALPETHNKYPDWAEGDQDLKIIPLYTASQPVEQQPSAGDSLTSVPDEVFAAEFAAWWDEHGQFCRAGGGDYERTFAFEAWRHLYPRLMSLQKLVAEQQPAPDVAGLVEALCRCHHQASYSIGEREALEIQLGRVRDIANEALAAYRKQEGEK